MELEIISIILRTIVIGLDVYLSIINFKSNEIKNAVCWLILAILFAGLIALQVYRLVSNKRRPQEG